MTGAEHLAKDDASCCAAEYSAKTAGSALSFHHSGKSAENAACSTGSAQHSAKLPENSGVVLCFILNCSSSSRR